MHDFDMPHDSILEAGSFDDFRVIEYGEWMTMAEAALILIAMALMFGSLIMIIVPVVPVAALEWAIGIVFAALTGFHRVTPAAALAMTGLMILGSTSGLWMPFLGLRGKEMSCLGLVGFFVGCIFGTVFIPIPLIGSVIGGIAAVFIIQLVQSRNARQALQSSGTALKLVFYGMVAEFLFAAAIIGVFLFSVATTG
jgi:uncharacterized protein YqgC (DUF456 family)